MKKIIFILFATLAIASCDLLGGKDSESFSDSVSDLVPPANDISIAAIETTPFVKQGEVITVDIIVTNSGTSTVDEEFEMSLNNQSEDVIIGNKTLTSGLAPEDSIKISYSWNTEDVTLGDHILVAKHTFEDENAANDSLQTTVTVSESDSIDIAVSEIRLPDMIQKGEVVDIEVDVKNIGTLDVDEPITITLNDLTDAETLGTQEIEGEFVKGDSTTLTFSWDTRGSSLGGHELEARHDFDDENTANDSQTTSVTVNETPVADIAVSTMDAPSEATQGDRVQVTTTVENLGNQDVDQGITVSLVNQDNGATIDSESISGGVDAGASQSLTLNWDTEGVAPGNYTLIVSHNFADDNAANNSRMTSVSINETPVADIAVSSVEAPTEVTQGDQAEVDVTVGNTGNKDAGAGFSVTLRDRTDNAQVGSKSVSGLAAGASTTLTFSWNTQEASLGSHELEARHDFDDENTANNSRTTSVNINETPVTDIAVSSMNAPSEVTRGDQIEVSITVGNTGNKDTSENITVVLRDRTDNTQVASKSVSGLDAGASTTLIFSWDTQGASLGAHELEARHDFDDENTANDSQTTSVTVNETPVADIAISSIAAPSEATQGDQVQVTTTIENLGNQDIDQGITVSLVNQNNGATIESKSISEGIDAGASQSLTLNWDTEGVASGSYTLKVSHNFADDNTANDSRTTSVMINEAPVTDIAVSSMNAPSEVTRGDQVEVSITVGNTGSKDASAGFSVILRDRTDNVQVGSKSVSRLQAGASTTLIFSWDTQGASLGAHELEARHDFDDENTANDSRTTSVNINETPVTDIAVSSMDAPSEATQGDQVEVTTTIENLGNQDVDQDLTVSLVNQNNGSTIESKSISGGLDAGESQSLTLNWHTEGVAPSSYTLKISHNFADDNAGNDSRTTGVTINEAPVTDIGISSMDAPSEVTRGDQVEVSVTVGNIGNKDTPENITVVLRDRTDNTQVASKSVSGLDAGASTTLTFSWDTQGASLGAHELEARHDFDDENAGNDSQTTNVTVNEPPVTDIAVSSMDAPSEATQGDQVQVTTTVENLGNQDVNQDITVSLVNQNNGSTIESESISGGLNVGESQSLTLNWDTEGVAPGSYTLIVSHNFADDNAGNDSRTSEIQVIDD